MLVAFICIADRTYLENIILKLLYGSIYIYNYAEFIGTSIIYGELSADNKHLAQCYFFDIYIFKLIPDNLFWMSVQQGLILEKKYLYTLTMTLWKYLYRTAVPNVLQISVCMSFNIYIPMQSITIKLSLNLKHDTHSDGH